MQIFLTANPKLRSEVAKQFHKLRAAVLRDLEEAKRLEELSNQDYASLDDIPPDAFRTTKQYLRAVDATLVKPFFPRFACRDLFWNAYSTAAHTVYTSQIWLKNCPLTYACWQFSKHVLCLSSCASTFRLEGGGLVHQEHAHNEDMGGIESLIDMDTGFSDDESDEEVCMANLV